MTYFFEQVDAWLTVAVLALLLFAAWGSGRWFGGKVHGKADEAAGGKFIDASLALLGLLLAFTFSMSLGRHQQRRAMVVAESNAIGDFATCASLLKDPIRARLQTVIRDYAQSKYDTARQNPAGAELDKALKRFQEAQARMTNLVSQAVNDGTPVVAPLTNTLNNLTSSDASRLAAYRDRLPGSIVLLLSVAAIVALILIGREQGVLHNQQVLGPVCFILLVCLVVYVTLDLNQPGRGLITVSQEPFERLLAGFAR